MVWVQLDLGNLWVHKTYRVAEKVLPNSFLCFSFNLNFQYI